MELICSYRLWKALRKKNKKKEKGKNEEEKKPTHKPERVQIAIFCVRKSDE